MWHPLLLMKENKICEPVLKIHWKDNFGFYTYTGTDILQQQKKWR